MIVRGEALPRFDVHAPLLSLPGLLATTSVAAIPAPIPYLASATADTERWRQRLSGLTGYRVGIAWQGSPLHPNDGRRSVPLSLFSDLADIPGIDLISLQKGLGREQLSSLAPPFEVTDLTDELGDFADTAGLIAALDLVICIDSAVAHLAGGMGIAVWVLLPSNADWRWLRGRNDSPWYPTMRLFRQTRPKDWLEVFGRVSASLTDVVRRNLA